MNAAPSSQWVSTTSEQLNWPGQDAISRAWLADEDAHMARVLESIDITPAVRDQVTALATSLVVRVRAGQDDQSPVDAFMQQYDLSSTEGVLLMCLAEALLRIPDADTADALIADKLGDADWESHLGKSESMFVNASTWGLMLTGKMVRVPSSLERSFLTPFKKLVSRSGEPVIRQAVRQAMRIMGHQYVMGNTIKDALKRASDGDNRHYRYSFDMLGEAALTSADAERYFAAYQRAIQQLGSHNKPASSDTFTAPSISVKLSALHPRYQHSQFGRVLEELSPRLKTLALMAKEAGIALTLDAEEADRLQLSLAVFERVYRDPELDGWDGMGLVVQAYQKRALDVLARLSELATETGRRLPLRLVKGAYWDTEIKRSQEQGLEGYPVFTRKINTDCSYLACASWLLARREIFYPQFATHNAHTIAAVHLLAKNSEGYEFQRLHGMGEELYSEVIGEKNLNLPCRVYAPVGSHKDLLPYLVRRLLENGANTSFVNRISDRDLPVSEIVGDPLAQNLAIESKPHPHIPLPKALFGATRDNSAGLNFDDPDVLQGLKSQLESITDDGWNAAPIIPGSGKVNDPPIEVTNPANRNQVIGHWQGADEAMVAKALDNAAQAGPRWSNTPVRERADCLLKAAELMEEKSSEFLYLLTREAGKSLVDGWAEIREAVDFCRYYASSALAMQPMALPGPTGESNEITVHGRGSFAAISPWNFPLAIFAGQVTAALVTGNAVLAKPAEQTTLVGHLAVQLLHEAGVPKDVLQFVPGEGRRIGPLLTADPRLSGVAFTGSTETAQAINRALAARDGALPALVAETGGLNAMIADSSALPEQLVNDLVDSAFMSAGQRCSAARVLFVQKDVAPKVLEMLEGAMQELVVGDPAMLATDVGPVIDASAQKTLLNHIERMNSEAKLIAQTPLPDWHEQGTFVAPSAFQLERLDQLKREVFGPVLHVIPFRGQDLDQVLDQINASGYGLTLGIHSRIEDTVERIRARARVGNCYVNRNMIGAVVGVQPFGGEGLSGTGPKAGGPHYLHRFVTERTFTVNTAAVGGNASLLAMQPALD
ncbi:MAG: bifunctional proline dehydrogenase/L-glutamate gamma-semialdehyde dehydrogenase PutA [Lysobacterales bacterium]